MLQRLLSVNTDAATNDLMEHLCDYENQLPFSWHQLLRRVTDDMLNYFSHHSPSKKENGVVSPTNLSDTLVVTLFFSHVVILLFG